MRLSLLAPIVVALSLVAGAARADAPSPPRPPAPVPQASGGHHGRRVVFAGLLASLFLIVGAAAGKNDKPSPKKT